MLLDIVDTIIGGSNQAGQTLGLGWIAIIALSLLLVTIIISLIATIFSSEVKTTRAVEKLNVYLESNPFINDEILVEFNKLMKKIVDIELKSSEDEKVYLNMNFLGVDLSKVPMQNWKDVKVFIIPLLYIVTTFINIKLSTNLTNPKKKEEDKEVEVVDKDNNKKETQDDQLESMQQMTKSMNYMMPIMSVAIALVAPLGLSLYWFVTNVLQLIERFTINFFMKKKEQEEAK